MKGAHSLSAGLDMLVPQGLSPAPSTRELARYAIDHAFRVEGVELRDGETVEDAADEMLDMLGLKINEADVLAGLGRTTPERPRHTPQTPAGTLRRKR